ncbi:MAG TPA: GTPase HflX [Gemmatimonadales bacterium]|nr:GTPase HflX [Gemmatimonadales bacterium]
MSPRQLITVAPPIERVLLVGAPRKGTPEAREVEEHLDELARLADTAGAVVVGRIVQLVAAPNPETWIGAGKVEEIRQRIAESGATMVIFDEELSPRQGKHLEDEFKLRVMDRTELILDIFALRARSREARMQVELAQSEYLLPRLTRMWVHLSRIRGGIGLRGPGETQLEVDRRLIRHKITQLKSKLEDVAAHRARMRARVKDRGVRKVALVGYTNAGKSSLLRALTGANTHVEDRLFATLDTLSRETVLNGTRLRITDTVGFIRKLPHGLVASFRATLEEALDADVLVHVVDVAHPAWEDQAQVVGEVLDEAGKRAGGQGGMVIMALNKVDLLDGPDRLALQRLAAERGWEAVLTSAATGAGIPELLGAIAAVRA